MEFEFFIGTDVSKNELDFAVRKGKQLLFHIEIVNEPAAINAFLKELSRQPGFDLGKAVFCMEHTGIYNNHLLVCLHKKKANICLEAATHIKKSLGNIRGKNDKVDSIRIAEYAYDKREKLRMWAPKREIVQQLSHFAATRSRLIKVKKILKTPLKEAGPFVKKRIATQNSLLSGKIKKQGRKPLHSLILNYHNQKSDYEQKYIFYRTAGVQSTTFQHFAVDC